MEFKRVVVIASKPKTPAVAVYWLSAKRTSGASELGSERARRCAALGCKVCTRTVRS
jgi:hypothetical protein